MTTTPAPNRDAAFVDYLFQRCQQDKGFAARLRRADNPATEYQSWDTLAQFGINLEFENERLPFVTIAAAIGKAVQAKQTQNGTLKLGQAVARSFSDGNQSDQAQARLRRLLACDETEEVCRILRPLLSLIQNRVSQPLDYQALLKDLRWFHRSGQQSKARWAQQFYGKDTADTEEEA